MIAVLLEMSLSDNINLEFLKTFLNIITALIVAVFAGVVGQQLTLFWNIRQKRRELELSLLNQFYDLYGEGLSIYRLWNFFKDNEDDLKSTTPSLRWELLEQASKAEARMEAVIVKLASERDLSLEEIESLGRFRQKFQKFRESIKYNKKILWYYSEQKEYLELKIRACEVANILSKTKGEQPKILNLLFSTFLKRNNYLDLHQFSKKEREKQQIKLIKITSNDWEDNLYFESHPEYLEYLKRFQETSIT